LNINTRIENRNGFALRLGGTHREDEAIVVSRANVRETVHENHGAHECYHSFIFFQTCLYFLFVFTHYFASFLIPSAFLLLFNLFAPRWHIYGSEI